MPGAFAHMIAADRAKKIIEDNGLIFPTTLLSRYPEWMQSGAVGPDYPYLHHAIASHDASDSWADLLHYKQTGDVVREGVRILRARYGTDAADQTNFMRVFSWLLGKNRYLGPILNFLGAKRALFTIINGESKKTLYTRPDLAHYSQMP